jgi:cysteine synthase A
MGVTSNTLTQKDPKMTAIGNTPLIKLSHLTGSDSADVYVKWEGANPTGSMKDRMARSMIEGAEKRGELKPGGRVVEYTGGSTGGSLAMVSATRGYQAYFVSSNGFSEEKLQTMRAFGAEVEIVHAEGGILTADVIDRMIARAKELADEPGTFWPDQVNNLDNKRGYHAMGREILDQTDGPIDEFVMAVGGGGCISGNAEILKEHNPETRIIGVEPYYVRNVSGGDTSGKHRLEGIGLSFLPTILRLDLIDDVVPVKDEDAYLVARSLARTEGLFGGVTSGANVWAALKRAKELGPGKKVVTVIVDTGLRYLNSDLYR